AALQTGVVSFAIPPLDRRSARTRLVVFVLQPRSAHRALPSFPTRRSSDLTGTGGGGGEYPLQDGFGWTNGVTLKMLDLICPKEQPCDNVPATRPTVKSATTQPSTKEAQPTP